jgi:hypothetical protein
METQVQRESGSAVAQPEWVRVPDALKIVKVCRATLYGWIKRQEIRSRSVKKPGCIMGVRLIHVPSLLKLVEESEA